MQPVSLLWLLRDPDALSAPYRPYRGKPMRPFDASASLCGQRIWDNRPEIRSSTVGFYSGGAPGVAASIQRARPSSTSPPDRVRWRLGSGCRPESRVPEHHATDKAADKSRSGWCAPMVRLQPFRNMTDLDSPCCRRRTAAALLGKGETMVGEDPNLLARYDGRHLLDELTGQREVLAAMFEDPGLARLARTSANHPAVLHHARLNRIVANGGRAENVDDVIEPARFLMDRWTWARVGAASFWDVVTDEEAQLKVRSRIRDPRQYADIVTELFYWRWLELALSQPISLVEQRGLPDLRIETTPCVWAEVKRIHLGTVPSKIVDDIKVANRQIRKAQPAGAGMVFVYVERGDLGRATGDDPPADIVPFLARCEAALRPGRFRSVAYAVITWDDYLVVGPPGAAQLWAARRQSRVLPHPQPRSRPHLKAEALQVGMTTEVWMVPGPQPQRAAAQFPRLP